MGLFFFAPRLRARLAPGFPCALSSREGQRIGKAQAKSRRENENACPVIASEAKQSSSFAAETKLECFVASLLAMTKRAFSFA